MAPPPVHAVTTMLEELLSRNCTPMAAVLTLQEMADKAASLLGIDPSLSLTQKVAKANDIAGVKPYGMSLKQQVDNIEKLIRKAAFITRELGIPPGLSMNKSISAAFAAVDSKPAGSSLSQCCSSCSGSPASADTHQSAKPRVCRLCQQRLASGAALFRQRRRCPAIAPAATNLAPPLIRMTSLAVTSLCGREYAMSTLYVRGTLTYTCSEIRR